MYADDLVLCGESEEDLRVIGEWFVEVCRRRGLKVNAGKRKGMVMSGEEGLECEDWGSFKVFIRIKLLGMCFG